MSRGRNTPLNKQSRLAHGLPLEQPLPDDTDQATVVHDKQGNVLVTYWKDKDDEFHREGDRPAVVWGNGTNEYYHHGKRHRIGGPAVIKPDGETQSWVKGKKHS